MRSLFITGILFIITIIYFIETTSTPEELSKFSYSNIRYIKRHKIIVNCEYKNFIVYEMSQNTTGLRFYHYETEDGHIIDIPNNCIKTYIESY